MPSTQHPAPSAAHPPAPLRLQCRAAIASPAFAAVLRYNQRGVGRSSGSRSVRCRADLDDVAAACAYLRDQLPLGPERRICVVG